MSSGEFNKFAGAGLGALLLLLLLNFFSEKMFHSSHHDGDPIAFAFEVESGPVDPVGPVEPDWQALLASADPADGEKLFKACAACHQMEDGANGLGPHLYGVVGRDIASVGGFAYSSALEGIEGDWDLVALAGFLENPKGWAPGTKMGYGGMKKPEDRVALIMWMNEAGGSPIDLTAGLPEPEGEAAPEEEPAPEGEAAPEDEAAATDGEAAPEDEAAATDGEAAPEGEAAATDGEAAPEDEAAATDGEAAPEDEAAATDGEAAPEDEAAVTEGEAAPEDEAAATDGEAAPEDEAAATDGEAAPEDEAAVTEGEAAPEDEAAVTEGEAAPEDEAAATDGEAAPEGETELAAVEPEAEEPATGGMSAGAYAELLAAGDASKGEKVFRSCRTCHKVEDGGRAVGPHLWGVVGRAIGSVEGYKYSKAMAAEEGDWTLERLMDYLGDPRGVVPGTKMVFRGVPDEQDRMNLILWLNEADGTPVEFN